MEDHKPNNFTDITASKETLARFLSDLTFGKGCDECNAESGWRNNVNELINAWNNRVEV